jgi:FkbM family methyltransferase
MNPLLKYHAKQLAAAFGITLGSALPRRSSMEQFCRHVKNLGYSPRSVVDVGVADGTLELHKVFPDAEYLLVEPLEEFSPALNWLKKRYAAHVALCAAGSEDATTRIQFGPSISEMHGATTVSIQDPAERAMNRSRNVPMRRLDTLIPEFGLKSPILLKIDAQGTELDIVEGAEQILQLIDIVILEATFFSFNREQPLFDETLAYMLSRGFYPYDMFGGLNRPLDGALGQIDIAFVHRDGWFRRDQRYAELGRKTSWIEGAGMVARRWLRA